MPQGPNGEKRPADVIGRAVQVAKIATGEVEDTKLVQPKKAIGGRIGCKARAARADEESQNIDGYVGDTPYSVKPESYKVMGDLPEAINVKTIFYDKKKMASFSMYLILERTIIPKAR